MSKESRNDYLILSASVVLLALGWGMQLEWPLIAAAALGFLLAMMLVVSAIRNREFGSDALALLAIVGSGLIGEWLASAVITVMLATGRSLERWAQGRANNRLAALLARAPKVAHVVDSAGNLRDSRLSQVQIGTKILVRSGEVVPLDAIALSDGNMDESALTGEPIPRNVFAGNAIASGVVNAGDSIELQTTSSESDSTYSALIRLVAQSKADTASGVRLANRWAVWFVPFALALAAAAWFITKDVSNVVAVIVAATPCPLILAVPIAIIAGMSRSAASGSIVKGGSALEALARTRTVMLDKTGTLTHGGPAVSMLQVAPAHAELEVLRLAASLEQFSPHVVAKAIVAEAQAKGISLVRPESSNEVHGHGLAGIVEGNHVAVGQLTSELPTWVTSTEVDEFGLMIAIEVNGAMVGIIGMADPVRQEAVDTMAALHRLGVSNIVMATGDRQKPAQAVALAVGIDQVEAECTPERKLALVRQLQQLAKTRWSRATVVAIGDGINDAPALAAADVGVAMGARGATAASEAADVVILEDSLIHLPRAIAIAQGAMSRASQAAGVGIALSVAAMVLAMLGVLSPTGAALTQEAIDASAILWALVPPFTSKTRRG